MYREGPDSAGNIVRANVLYQTHTYTLISKTQIDYTGTHTRINDLETQKQGRPVFKIEPENGFRTLCPWVYKSKNTCVRAGIFLKSTD